MLRFFIIILGYCTVNLALAGSYTTLQTSKMSPVCPIGSQEAEAIHQTAREYRKGAKGKPINKALAESLFEKALAMGNAKSALQLGKMYFSDYSRRYPKATRNKYMMAMYAQALKMGCPDAYLAFAQSYENGWGTRKDKEKAIEMLRLGAESGSPKAMEFYGEYLIKQKKDTDLGLQWLQRSMDAGNGDAGMVLASFYLYEKKDTDGYIRALRAGAQQGSKECLMHLYMTYVQGYHGQEVNKQHAACYDKLRKSIDDIDPPKPIPDFDKTCPMRPAKPFKW